jgi:hypothetical protein
MARFDLAIGMRIHGAVAAIQAGKLGICTAFDSRTLELAQTMGYPYITAYEIGEAMGIKDILEQVTFYPALFDEKKQLNLSAIWELFSRSGISTSLTPPGPVSDESFITAVKDELLGFARRQTGIPDDFDHISYLIQNPDLLQARVNPYRHYLECGRRENRSYKAANVRS